MGNRKRLGNSVLSLTDFLHRNKVLNYYRGLLRLARRIDSASSQELAGKGFRLSLSNLAYRSA